MHAHTCSLLFQAGIDDYVDSDIHSVVRIAEQALLQNSDCGPALTWCTENASKLRRLERYYIYIYI
jgi:hypothetical protein